MRNKDLKNIIRQSIKELVKEQNPVTGQAFGAGGVQQKARGAEYWAQHPAELAKRLGISEDSVPEHLAFWQAELEAEGCQVDLGQTGAPEPTPLRREGIQRLQEQAGPPYSVTFLANDFVSYLGQQGINFKELASCNQQYPSPAAAASAVQMFGWLNTIFALGPFQNGANNQPCNWINNKIDQFQTWIAAFTGNPNSIQLALKKCKLQMLQAMLPWAQQLYSVPGC